jgi:serine/threonine protein kinase
VLAVLGSNLVTRYELLDRIGVGGMAEIFRGKAVAAGGFEKPVAIKRILPHLSQDKRFVELLIAEAKVLSLLKHRNIVQIFDVGLGDDGQYFLVMEYVDGKDLGRIQRGIELRRGRIPFDLALHIGAEICEALEHAHSARSPDGKSMSLVHRDVSPSNVLMSRAGEVKLTDFGIAKRAEHEPTRHGAVRGKFAYISPEQARNEHLDPRSDVFPVGILLWELVTNRRLFSGLGDLEALRAVREVKIRRPREVDARLSHDIDQLIMAALAPSPRDRPTAGQLGAKLRTLRYALDVTVGDPATELAKIIDATAEAERMSGEHPAVPQPRGEFDGTEATVIRIHTAEHFSMSDQDGTGMKRAFEVMHRFEEEETRQAELTKEEIAFLHATAARDSGELTSAVEPPTPSIRGRRPSAEQTRASLPLGIEDGPTYPPRDARPPDDDDDENPFDGDEATRLLGPKSRSTPAPARAPSPTLARAPSPTLARTPSPAPAAPRPRPPTSDAMPATAHERGGRAPNPPPPPGPVSMSHPQPPQLPPPPATVPSVAGMQPMPQLLPQMQPPQMQPPQMQPPQMQPPQMQPPQMQPPQMQPPQMQPPQGGNYPNWGASMPARPMQPPAQMYDRAPGPRPIAAAPQAAPRRTPLKPWVLIVGALIMALLAFVVTRAFIHTSAPHTTAPDK